MAGTTPTSLAGSIQTESIEAFINKEPVAPRVFEAVANVLTDCTGASVQFLREVAGDTVASKAANAAFADSEYTTTFVNGVPAVMGDSTNFADEIAAQGSSVSALSTLNRIDERCNTRINKDLLAAGAGSSNHSDYTGVAFDVDKFIDSTNLYSAQNPSQPRHAFIGSPGQVAALTKANLNLVSGGAGGAFAAGLMMNGLKPVGFVTEYLGFEIYRSDVFVDGANASALLVSVAEFASSETNPNGSKSWQPGSGLAAAFWWKSRPGVDRIENATKATLVVSSYYVCKIAVPHNVRRITALK